MAKIKTPHKYFKNSSAAAREHRVPSTVTVQRWEYGASAFRACVLIGKQRTKPTGKCATGKNPRKAIQNALRAAAKTAHGIGSRTGAFAGMGGVKERRAARIVRSARRFKNLVVINKRKR